ncbi:hypothetical protein M569_06660, partial [Genlisea aurea]
PAFDPVRVLAGNFAPVAELPPTVCREVEGAIPATLRGTYVRNGPNPQFIPQGPYHSFDGDGMLHAVTFDGGDGEDNGAVFCSRFVKTYKYELERRLGFAVMPSVFSSFSGACASLARLCQLASLAIAGKLDFRGGIGAANTSLFQFAGKLFALQEVNYPYRMEITSDGDVITVGPYNFSGGNRPMTTMTAHPKIDVNTGEAFAFRYRLLPPFLVYSRINPEGTEQVDIPIWSLRDPSFIHDFAVTKNYAVFPDPQFKYRPAELMRGGAILNADHGKPPRLGILPKYAADEKEMRWIDAPGLNIIHIANAWEEDGGDTIVMVASNVYGTENAIKQIDHSSRLSFELVEIKPKENIVRRRPLTSTSAELPVINPAYLGKKSRYVYVGTGVDIPKMNGVAKLDLSLLNSDSSASLDCTVARHHYPHGVYGGEPYFVARDPNNPSADEDDGYILNYIHDEKAGESKFIIMDARSPTLQVLAAIKLPQRVPYGVHGIFLPQN